MITFKYHDINGNTYGLQVDHIKKEFKTDPLISISDKISAKKTTKKFLKEYKQELLQAGYIEIK